MNKFTVNDEGVLTDVFIDEDYVLLPETVKYIGRQSMFSTPVIEDNIEKGYDKHNSLYTHIRCMIKTIDISNTKIEVLPQKCFHNIHSLETFISNELLNNIPTECFLNNMKLEKIINMKKITHIGDRAFFGCKMLKKINLNDCLVIGSESFSNCSSLENIALPSIITIGTYAFERCVNISSVSIGDKITVLQNGVFFDNVSLTHIKIPKSVINIRRNAFGLSSTMSNSNHVDREITFLTDRKHICIDADAISKSYKYHAKVS